MPREQLRRRALHKLRAHPDPRLIGHRELLRARTPRNRKPLSVSIMRRIAGKASLADPRLPAQQHDLTPAHARQLQRFLKRCTLLHSPHVLHRRNRPQQRRQRPTTRRVAHFLRKRHPRHRERLQRIREAPSAQALPPRRTRSPHSAQPTPSPYPRSGSRLAEPPHTAAQPRSRASRNSPRPSPSTPRPRVLRAHATPARRRGSGAQTAAAPPRRTPPQQTPRRTRPSTHHRCS